MTITSKPPQTVPPTHASPENGTLLFKVTHDHRRVVKPAFDREQECIAIWDKSQHEASIISLQNITSVRYGTQATSPQPFNLDASVQPLWFTISYASSGPEETMYILAFGPQIAQSWPQVDIHTSNNPARPLARRTDHPTTIDKNRTHYVCRSWQASSFNLYHWSDWPFMIKLTHDRWSSTSIGELVAFNMSEAVEMEQLLGSLEEMKRDLWKAYALGNPEEALVLVESELPKAYEERAGELRPETRSFMAMQQLSRRRSRKAPAFDRLRMGGRAHPDASVGDLVQDTNIIGERFWAVVVGIDQYLNASGLSGCVNDANLMVDFLTSTLRVPGSHIVVLASSTSTTTDELQSKVRPIGVPSRAVILDALHSHFRDNDSVRYGDNLIFYFSGHGSSYGLFGPSATETVCPMDRGTTSSPRIYDISDRELNIIFSEIRDSKGPNLTVILDCCHTASHTHTLAHDPTVRALPPLNDPDAERCMFESAANDVRRQPDARSPLSPSWKGDMTSHVLLAACKPGESARELDVPRGTYPRLGVFTFALVSALRSPRGVDPALTYFNLIKSVIDHPESQTPVVAGKRKRERLWFQEGPLIEPTVLIRD